MSNGLKVKVLAYLHIVKNAEQNVRRTNMLIAQIRREGKKNLKNSKKLFKTISSMEQAQMVRDTILKLYNFDGTTEQFMELVQMDANLKGYEIENPGQPG